MVAKHQGFRDWLIQRITAIIIGAYTLTLVIYWLCAKQPNYFDWSSFFHNVGMEIFTLVTLVSILWHAWIGLWTIFTDYVKPTAIRYVLQTIVIALLLGYLIWTIVILW